MFFSVIRLTTLGILISLLLISCKKADPNPELKDPVSLSLGNQLKSIDAEIAAAKTAIVDAENEVKKVVPQTGQIKYAEKRLWAARNRLSKAEQMKKAVATQAEMRTWKVRVANVEAFHKGEEFNGAADMESQKFQNELDQKTRNWSVTERRAALGLKSGREPAALPSEGESKSSK